MTQRAMLNVCGASGSIPSLAEAAFVGVLTAGAEASPLQSRCLCDPDFFGCEQTAQG